jgi:hypothetical protein
MTNSQVTQDQSPAGRDAEISNRAIVQNIYESAARGELPALFESGATPGPPEILALLVGLRLHDRNCHTRTEKAAPTTVRHFATDGNSRPTIGHSGADHLMPSSSSDAETPSAFAMSNSLSCKMPRRPCSRSINTLRETPDLSASSSWV